MANPKATYEITSKDNSKKGVQSAKKGVQDLGKAGVANAAKMIAKWAAVAISIRQITRAVKASIEAFEQQEMAEISLAAAARNNPLINGDAYRGITEYASALQQATMFGDEALIQQASFLTTLQLSEQQIKDVLRAATNLASTGMMTLESATRNLAKTYGGMAGELGELIPQLKGLTQEQMRAGEAIELIENQYSGFAETVAQSSKGIKEQMRNIWGDFGEQVGEALAPLRTAILLKVKPILDALSSWMAAHSTQITNFFLHIPEVAAIAFGAIKRGFQYAFSWEGIWERIKAQLRFFKDMFVATFKFILSVWLRTAESIILIFGQAIRSIWDTVRRVGETIWAPLSAGFEWAVYGMRVGWRAMVEGLASGLQWLINNPINWLGQAFYNVAHGVGEIFEWTLGGVIDLINNVVDKLNRVIHAAQQVAEHGVRFRQYEEFDPSQGTIGGIGRKPTMDWGRGFQDFAADLIPEWKDALTPPDRQVGAEISEVWHGYGTQLVEDWKSTFEGLGDTWEGFGGDIREYLESVVDSNVDFNRHLIAPFREELQAIRPQLNQLLSQELPFEIRSVVEQLVDELDMVADETVDSISRSMIDLRHGLDAGNMSHWANEALSSWEMFSLYLKLKAEKLKANFTVFFNNMASFGVGLYDGFLNIIDKVEGAMASPLNTLGNVGFDLVRNLDSIGEGVLKAGSAIGQGLLGVGQLLLSFGSTIIGILRDTEAFQTVMGEFMDVVNGIAEDVVKPLIVESLPLIRAIVGLVRIIGGALAPLIQSLSGVFNSFVPIIKALGPFFQALSQALISLVPVLEMVVDALGIVLVPVIKVLTTLLQGLAGIFKTLTPVVASLLNIVVALLTPVINFVGQLLTIVLPIIQLVAQALLLLAPIIDGLASIIGAILTPIFQFLGELLQAIFIPVIQVLSSVLGALTPIFQVIGIILKSITPILNLFGRLIILLLTPIQFMGDLMSAILVPLFELLGMVLAPLVPLFDLLAKVVDITTRPLELLADVVTYVVDVFQTIGHNLIQFFLSLISFGLMGGDYKAMPSFSSDAFSRPIGQTPGQDSISLPSIGDVTTGVDYGDTSSGVSSGRGASYGGQNLTVNVQITAEAIVGEPGLREFALMIENEISRARNLGIV